jgi:hypothetical protein
MNIPDIVQVKGTLEKLKEQNLLAGWELPYENLLTRLTAALFFIDPADGVDLNHIWREFQGYADFNYSANTERKLSAMKYRLTFNKDDKGLD